MENKFSPEQIKMLEESYTSFLNKEFKEDITYENLLILSKLNEKFGLNVQYHEMEKFLIKNDLRRFPIENGYRYFVNGVAFMEKTTSQQTTFIDNGARCMIKQQINFL